MTNYTGHFTVNSQGEIAVDYLYDGGWFRGELGVFNLKGLEEYEPGSTAFIKEAARRVLSNSEAGHILIQDETEGAKFSGELPWERDFNTGTYQGTKTFNLTPGDEVGLMLVQHSTIAKVWETPQRNDQFGQQVIFSLPEANNFNASSNGHEIVDVNGHGVIAWEDVPINQADRDYNDLIIDLQGLSATLPTLAGNVNPLRDWREHMVLWNGELNLISDDDLVMHLELDERRGKIAADSSSEGKNNFGELQQGTRLRHGIVEFDGKNDLLQVPDSSDINTTTHSQRTIAFWFKTDEIDIVEQIENPHLEDPRQILYEEGGWQQDDAGLNVYIDDGRIYFGGWDLSEGNWAGTYLSSDQITAGSWHHAVLVLDAEPGVDSVQSNVFRAYLDGVHIGSGNGMELSAHRDNIGLGGLNETTKFHDGIAELGSDFSLGGNLDDIRLYNRALTATEISTLYHPNHDPTALDDEVLTAADTEISLTVESLLTNDTDLDGNSLNLTSVSSAINGTVELNETGQVTFTPEAGVHGPASFQYTVNDGHGGSDTAQVDVTVLPPAEPISLGTNLHRLADWSPQFPFVNAFESARQWIPQDWGATPNDNGAGFRYIWDTREFELLDLDEEGWVKSLPAPEDDPEYSSVGTLMFRNVGEYPGGKYIVSYEGEGTLEYGLDGVKDEAASAPGRDVIEVTPSSLGLLLRIAETDPNQTGGYIRDIKVIPEEFEYAQEQNFNPQFLEKIQPFGTLRFMDWMATNNSTQGEWRDRPTPDSSIFSGEIASVEAMVELANLTQSDPWFTMPHMATDEYVTNFANYVKDNLDPELKIYVEYSNEVWNLDFGQAWWVEERGKEEFADSPGGDFYKRLDWFGQRTTEITQIWDKVFESDQERVVGVLGAQAANLGTGRRPLDYAWTDNPLSHEEYGIDAIAIAPYFGNYLGKPEYEAAIESWIDDDHNENLALDNLFKEIKQGGVLSDAPAQGALQQAYNWTKNYAALAEEHGLDLLTYESGQHLNGTGGVEDNDAIGDLFITANRDPRMGEIYQQYFSTLKDLGVELAVNYTDTSRYNKYGSWGLLENIGQTNAPKYNAVKSLAIDEGKGNAPVIEELKTNLSSLKVLLAGESLTLDLRYSDLDLTDHHQISLDWDDNNGIVTREQEPLLGEVGQVNSSHVYNKSGVYNIQVKVTDDRDLTSSESLAFSVAETLTIDWQTDLSQIELTGNDNLTVAILGTENFDPATIDTTSIRADDEKNILLDGTDASAIANDFRLIDTNSDGWEDLEVTFTKSSLRNVVNTNAEPFLSNEQIYLFGSSSMLEGSFFLGAA